MPWARGRAVSGGAAGSRRPRRRRSPSPSTRRRPARPGPDRAAGAGDQRPGAVPGVVRPVGAEPSGGRGGPRVRRGDAAARLKAIRELEHLGPQDPEVALPALIDALDDPEPVNRGAAAEGLVAVIPGVRLIDSDPGPVREAVAALMDRLGDPEPAVRVRASESLCTIVLAWHGSRAGHRPGRDRGGADAAGPTTPTPRSAWRPCGGSPRWRRRLSDDAPPPRLIAALEDQSEAVRIAAAQALARSSTAMLRMLAGAGEVAWRRPGPSAARPISTSCGKSAPQKSRERSPAELISALLVASSAAGIARSAARSCRDAGRVRARRPGGHPRAAGRPRRAGRARDRRARRTRASRDTGTRRSRRPRRWPGWRADAVAGPAVAVGRPGPGGRPRPDEAAGRSRRPGDGWRRSTP